jgi:hypothetical protein
MLPFFCAKFLYATAFVNDVLKRKANSIFLRFPPANQLTKFPGLF